MNKLLPTPADDLAVGLWQLSQRGQASPSDRAVFSYIHELQASVAATQQRVVELAEQVAEYAGLLAAMRQENARLNALNTELNAKWREERVLLLDGGCVRYDMEQTT